ncbi:hypothetical protein P4575_26875 [Priestia megaterium]|uniref:hypothetical protein n=1 Tax=Priestia megaterium TaxID=1404 RepID=UPI002E21E66D|nr:hypothetical protein [Priestia megaterium]
MNENKEVINVFTTEEVQGFNNILFMRYWLNKLNSESYTLFVDVKDGSILNVWTPSTYIWKVDYETDYDVFHIKELLLNKAKEWVAVRDHSTDEKFLRNIKEVIRTMHNKKEMQSIKTVLETNGFSSLEHIRTDEVNKVYLFKGLKSGMDKTHLTISALPDKLCVYHRTYSAQGNDGEEYEKTLTFNR